jgi:hypothetical protein
VFFSFWRPKNALKMKFEDDLGKQEVEEWKEEYGTYNFI